MQNEAKIKKELHNVICISLCILFFLIGLGFWVLRIYSNSYMETLEQDMVVEVENYEQRIYRQLRRDFKLLNSLSSMIGTANLYNNDVFADTLLKTNCDNDFLTMAYFDTNEEGYLSICSQNRVIPMTTENTNKEIQNIVSKTLKGQKAISDVFVGDITHQRIVLLGVPVYFQGEIIGSLVATDEIEVFEEIINADQYLSDHEYLHLLNSKGEYVIQSSHKVIEDNVDTIFEGLKLEDSLASEIKEKMIKGKRVVFSFDYNNHSYRTMLNPIQLNGWYLMCVHSTESIYSGFSILRFGIIVFVTVTLIILLSLLLAGYNIIKKNNSRLNKIAYYDELTGLYNMHGFTDALEQLTQSQEGYGIVVLNIRKFKFINEVFGKKQADNLLCLIADIISEQLNEGECACRESGDTFYIYFDQVNERVIRSRIEGIINKVETSQAVIEHNYCPTLRCGYAIRKDGQDLSNVCTHAMFALEITKKYLNQNIWLYDEHLHEQERIANYVEQHSQDAIDKRLFKLYLQPKVNLKNNRIGGAEALVRWQRENGDLIFPGDFIPIFEKNGFCIKLDLYMFEEVCRQIRTWIDAELQPVEISINQSKITIFESNYIECLQNLIEKYDIPAHFITIEILEGFTIDNVEDFNSRLDRLRAVGFHISMDDFGSGYSSLNVLGKLSIDELKLDREFLLSATNAKDSRNGMIMEEIVKLSQRLSISTVVEGVESEFDDAFVKDIGCELGQGYYYSYPVCANEFTDKFMKTPYVFGEFIRNTNHFVNNISMTKAFSILRNSKVGIWAIEIPKSKKEAPRMSVNINMLRLLGVSDHLTCEQIYDYWYKRIHPSYVSLVQDGVEKIMHGENCEVEYPWHHPTKGWIYVRCGGYLHEEKNDAWRSEGYHQEIESLLQKNDLLYSDDFDIYDRLRLHKYSYYCMDVYDGLCEIDVQTDQIDWIFEIKNKYINHENEMSFEVFVQRQIHPDDQGAVLFAYNEVKNKKLDKNIVSVRMMTIHNMYTMVRLVFIREMLITHEKVLMASINIREEKEIQELQKNREVILSMVAENDVLIYDVNLNENYVLSLRGEDNKIVKLSFESYRESIQNMAKLYLNSDKIEKFLSIAHLKTIRNEESTKYLDIQKNNIGYESFMQGWYRITLSVKSQLENHVIIMIKRSDRFGIVSNIIQQYINRNFEVIYSVNSTDDTFTKFAQHTNTEDIQLLEGHSFISSCRNYIEKCVVSKDKERILHELNYDSILRKIEENIIYSIEFGIYDEKKFFHQKKVYFHLHDNANKEILIMVVDVTDHYMKCYREKREIETLQKEAMFDGLTELNNRYYFETEYQYYLENEGKYQESAFLLIDLDNFKKLNDTYGHLVGDKALQVVAKSLREFFRSTDIIARFGGDEFVVLMKHIRGKEILDPLMDRFLSTMNETFNQDQQLSGLHVSVGISLIPEDGMDFKELYEKADQALYEVKKKGKNSYFIYQKKDVGTDAK